MKKKLFLMLLFGTVSAAMAQTNTWIGTANTNWNVLTNWSLGTLPTATNDVIIPTGKTVTINVNATAKSILVNGNAVLNIVDQLTFTNASAIASTATVNWTNGSLTGGGTLINNGTFTISGTANKTINGITTLTNAGTMTMSDTGDIYITNGVLNNNSAGTFTIIGNANVTYSGSSSHVFNNSGILNRTTGTGAAAILATLNNTGTINVKSGILNISDAFTALNGGIYNVDSGCILRWSSTVTCTGILTGILNGEIDWAGTVNVATATTATFNFTGTTGVKWSNGTLSGGGTLLNKSPLTLSSSANKIITGITTLNNESTMTFANDGDLYINDGIVNNRLIGTINLNVDAGNLTYSGSTSHILNNLGTINKSGGNGLAYIYAELRNSGTIKVDNGTLELNNANTTLTGGVYHVAAGKTLRWNATINCSGTLTGVLNGEIDWSGTVNVASSATFNFTGTIGVNWSDGVLTGGGTLTNSSVINLNQTANKVINGITTINNTGTMNFTGAGDLYVNDGVLNNQSSGVIDIRVNDANITYFGSSSHVLNNLGLIKKTASSGTATLYAELHNSGTIRVETGVLEFNNAQIQLNSGIYNVFATCNLKWFNAVSCSGTLTGAIAGKLEWYGTVTVPTTATFNFTGNGVSWTNGVLNGGGTLTNNSTLNMETSTNKIISGFTTLTNASVFTIVEEGDLYVNDGIVNNLLAGTINMKANNGNFTYSGSNSHVLNNAGTISRNTGTGTAEIMLTMNNTGRIDVTSGILNITNAQTTLTGGTYNTDAGKILRWSDTVTCSGLLSGVVNGEINWVGIVKILPETTASFNFTGAGFVNWTDGTLNGGGTLNNNSLINMSTGANKIMNQLTTLNNNAVFNVSGEGDLYVNEGVFNNTALGIVNMKSDQGNFTYSGSASHTFNNLGTINRNTGNGIALIYLTLNNTGTLNVDSGTLNISNPQTTFTNGVYKVAATKILQLSDTVTCTGTLTGAVNGEILWTNTISVATTATFDFTGSGFVNWSDGTLNGGGTLTSKSPIHLTGTTNKFLNGITTLNNEDQFIFMGSGDLYVNDGVVNNQLTGVIELKVPQTNLNYSGSTSHIVNNFGLIKKTTDVGTCDIYTILNNSGIVDVQLGTLDFSGSIGFNNNENGIVMGVGKVGLGANFTNNGAFAPGGSPGKLTVSGEFRGTALSKIAVELNGLTAVSQYDVMEIQGNALVNGTIAVDLNFAPVLNDQFTIATTSGIITQFGVTPTTTAEFNGLSYTFSVSKVLDKNVVLKVVLISALATENLLSIEKKIMLSPMPASTFVTLRNDSGLDLTEAIISDLNGRTVRIIDLRKTKRDIEIPLDGFASGQYLVKVNAPTGNSVKRLIVK